MFSIFTHVMKPQCDTHSEPAGYLWLNCTIKDGLQIHVKFYLGNNSEQMKCFNDLGRVV